eukprot:TRINITY_DN2398_c0_g1_i3.p1 TRINITY_DN2398_c0_g1~~TRINITY_DN2398_c0_g1_i3.p1  ORF type:complete len:142 (-),score=16.90 TRINITY_DN2398_c0_g1_i3:223-648(-)
MIRLCSTVLCQGLKTIPKKLPTVEYIPSNSWAEHKALSGQNDYIDILGNEEIHPKQIMYHVPKFMKDGHKKERWSQMALRRKKMLENTPFPKMYPRKWDIWCKEIKREMLWLNKHVDQNWYANYEGITTGPVKNPYKPKRF